MPYVTVKTKLIIHSACHIIRKRWLSMSHMRKCTISWLRGYSKTKKNWNEILHWLRIIMVQPTHVADHFYQFETLGGFSKSVRLVFTLIWISCAWEIWKERNVRVFRQKESSL